MWDKRELEKMEDEARGKLEGKVEGKVEILFNKLKMTPEDIAKDLNITLEQVKDIIASLDKS